MENIPAPDKCSKELYCNFLLSASKAFTATHLSQCLENVSHDKITRWLKETKLTPRILWEKVEGFVVKNEGYLVGDDSVLDKSFSRKNRLASWQYSGTRHRVVMGIGLTSLLWTGGGEHIPIDFRIYAKKTDGKTKNGHFRDMLTLAHYRGFRPKAVLFDSWYTSLENLKLIRKYGWIWVAPLASTRTVSPSPKNYFKISDLTIPEGGLIVHLKDYGMIKVFKIVRRKEDIEYLATNNLELTLKDGQAVAAVRWKIEEYHRGLKQAAGIERCPARSARSQRTHIFCAILSFVNLEINRLKGNISWYDLGKTLDIYAVKQYLRNPILKIEVVGG